MTITDPHYLIFLPVDTDEFRDSDISYIILLLNRETMSRIQMMMALVAESPIGLSEVASLIDDIWPIKYSQLDDAIIDRMDSETHPHGDKTGEVSFFVIKYPDAESVPEFPSRYSLDMREVVVRDDGFFCKGFLRHSYSDEKSLMVWFSDLRRHMATAIDPPEKLFSDTAFKEEEE